MREEKHDEEVRKKEIFYRGKNLQHLKTLDAREIAKYLDSRTRRSIMRNFDKIENFTRRAEKKIAKNKKIRTHLRDIIIVPKLAGMTIGIYNGKNFYDVAITAEMIGHRLGEFALTRGKVVHGAAGIGATKSSKAQKK
ncbi:ribosomal protein S19 family protein [Candidatus Pacearchaeota archaeon]|nr:ribosomal protein S19 family protein [Candidatus Pacearchaeota archaeon]